jgi:hypothetical protein
VFGAFGGFADDARVEDGFMTLSDRPGIGFEGQAQLYGLMLGLTEQGRPSKLAACRIFFVLFAAVGSGFRDQTFTRQSSRTAR